METIFLFHNSKWFTSTWVLLFTLSLIVLWVNRTRWIKGYKTFFWLIVVSILIVYCPLLAIILVPRFLPSFAEYERLSWVFFEIPLISYTLIMLAMDFKSKRNRYLFVAFFLILFMFIGSPDNRSFYLKAKNKYRISQDAVEICDKIDKLSPNGSVVICVQLEHGSHYQNGSGIDGMLYYGIRTYESRFQLQYTDIHPERYAEGNFYLFEDLSPDIDYYLCPKAGNIYRTMASYGYVYIGESENFAILQNKNKHKNGENL